MLCLMIMLIPLSIGMVHPLTSRKHLRTKVTPDFHLTYSKMGDIWGRNQNDKMDTFQYFSIKSYVLDVY